ncbi:centromere-associated protein E isoform X2 [Mixophyes fleayi]|uniref:centromere-associated protein E isoform X2 n=1 Tax=Mixophyes fleayi TaxID=3061075 RepID=UPI003F4DDD09
MAEGDAVKVCVRIRPIIQREQEEQVTLLWKAENSTIFQVDGTKSFNFDRVFDSHETTSQVYQEVAVPIIRSALQGYNGTIFAYGQTSSGKTYTMMGSPNNLGIIPQAVQEVFQIIQEIPNREFLLRVSYMEIYNETVTDLLCEDGKKKPLEIREDINRNVYVASLTEELVMAPEHVMKWIKKGEKNRHYGETKMNDHSSRSHTIFRMIVESRERNGPGNSENCDGAVMVSHLNLVDLAGSERASQTGAEGMRLKEGCNINRSLFILGQVIKKLSDGQLGGFINYRDSKLTRILQNSLGGNTKTVIICTITSVSFDETLSTLQFASTAKHVRNTPHVNEVLDDEALLKRYRKEIMDLKKQLEDLEASSEMKAHAMAKEEHSQLLAEIKQLQKEREDRIWNLTNIVVASSQVSHEDKRVNRKRRVTWAPGKIQKSLCTSGVSSFESNISTNFVKRPKFSNLTSLAEFDDSIRTESDFDDATRVFDETALDIDFNFGSKVTQRERSARCLQMAALTSDAQVHSSAEIQDSISKFKDMEQKVDELEIKLKNLTKEYEVEVEKRESVEKETASLKQKVQMQEEKDELLKSLEQEVISLQDQLQSRPKSNEQSPETGDNLGTPEEQIHLKTNNCQVQDMARLNDLAPSTHVDSVVENPIEEQLSNHVHDICREQIQMLEQKIVDLEENHQQKDFVESLQICEALMMEKETALKELSIVRINFDSVVVENESLKIELAETEKYIEEKKETNEFEMLEKAAQKEQETQLIHENANLKTLIENAEVYNQELETELESKSKLLKEQEKTITELKKDAEGLQKKIKIFDLSASLGDCDKLCEEVFQLKQSLSDAETVTRDAQREAAFLRSENLELKEKMDELSIRCEQREKDASAYEKQLEMEKSNYKRMQADLQKELQFAFNEINQLNGLMAGRVPKDLLSRVELEKKIADCTKQLDDALEEKNVLEKEVACLSEYKSLPNEVENLKNQVQKTSEELNVLMTEKEQYESIVNDQKYKLQEQIEQIEKLTEEVTLVQAKCHQTEQQYSELKQLHEDLAERCLFTAEEIKKKDEEAESLLKEMDELKQSVVFMEHKLSTTLQERHELVQAKQELAAHTEEMEEVHKSTLAERGNLQDQLTNLSSLVAALQQQAEKHSELHKEKQDFEKKNLALITEMEQLQEQLGKLQSSQNIMHSGDAEASHKLEELREEFRLVIQYRDELNLKVEDLKAEKDSLKQDLNENIELSIETQDELRVTQEELKQQKQLVADLRKQIAACAGGISLQAESQENLQEKTSMLIKQLQENKAKYETINNEKMELERVHQSVISEMEILQERIQSSELTLARVEEENNKLKQNHYCLVEQLRSVPLEQDELKNIANTLQEVGDGLKDHIHKNDEQACQINEQAQHFSEKHLLQDGAVNQEQQLIALQEIEKLHDALKNITAERDQLKLDLQENIEMSIETQEELRNALDELKNKSHLLDAMSSQVNGKDLENKILQLEEQLNVIMTERDKILGELKNVTEQKQESHCDNKDGFPVALQEELQQKTTEHQQLLQKAEELAQVNNSLSSEMESLKNNMMETQTMLESMQNIKLEAEKQLFDLQQQMEIVVQERDDLYNTQERLLVEINQHKENLKENSELVLQLKHELQQKPIDCQYEDLSQTQLTLKDETEQLMKNLKITEAELETLRSEKRDTEQRLLHLQHQMEVVTNELDALKTAQESLTFERDQLKENLEKNVEMVLGLQEELQQKASEKQDLIQKKEELERGQNGLRCEVESLTKSIMETQSTLKTLHNEKLETEQQLIALQQHMEFVAQEKNEVQHKLEKLIAEINYTKESNEMEKTTQEQQRPLEELSQTETKLNEFDLPMKNLKESDLVTLQNDEMNTEEHILKLQQHMATVTQETNELKARLQSVMSERDQLKEELRENVEMSIETQDDLRNTQEELQQQGQRVEHLTSIISSLEQKSSTLERELHDATTLLKEATSEREILDQSKQKLISEMEQLLNDLNNKEFGLGEVEKEKFEASNKIHELTAELRAVTEEKNQMQHSKENLAKESIETQEDLRRTQEELQQQKLKVEKLTDEVSILEDKSSSLERELQENIILLKESVGHREILDHAKQKLASEREQLMDALKSKDSELGHVAVEKEEASQKILELTKELKSVLQEKDQLQLSKENLQKESIETQDDLRKTQEELQQQGQRVEHLTSIISSLEQKSSTLERELHDATTLLKEATSEREILDQSKQKLRSEMEQLLNDLNNKEFGLREVEKEKFEASNKIHELTAELRAVTEEKDQMQHSKENLAKESIETQEDLRRTQEELQQQKLKVEKLTDEVSILEDKSSSLERELQENIILLKESVGHREILDHAKQKLASESELLMDALKSKDSELGNVAVEKEEASQKILELTKELKSVSQEKDQLQLSKENLQEEAKKLREEIQYLQHQHDLFAEQQNQKTSKLDDLVTEIKQLQEKIYVRDSLTQQLETDKNALQKQVQQYELDMASLRQEQEQFQQLLQRARSEKENIYSNLQDRENDTAQLREALNTSQTQLQAIKKERDGINERLLEKVSEVNELLQQISSLQQQLEELHQEVTTEKRNNWDLCAKVDLMEKEISILRSLQNDPEQEEDEFAERTDIFKRKNQEFTFLMENISTVCSNHHRFLNNISSELQSEIEAHKQSMDAIKKSLSLASSREFGSLQTEHFKINTHLQTLLNKFKVIYKNAAVKEENYSLINDCESNLCAVQKRNDELTLQGESLEQHGTKWSETASDDKFCELEFLTALLFKKVELIKRVEEGFSEVQCDLNSMEDEIKEEVKCKKQFLLCLEEFMDQQYDAKKLMEVVQQENRRVTGVFHCLTKKLKAVAQYKMKQDTMAYLNKLETDLQEKKEKNKELLQKMQHLAPSGDSDILQEENARLRDNLKNVQVDLKRLQCRIKDLENELISAKTDAKQREEKALQLEEKLLSSTAESELSEMQRKMAEKEKHLQTAQKEIQIFQEKVAKGAAPYNDEIESLKSEVAKIEMHRMKLSKSADKQIASLKACLEDKEDCLRKLKEQLRRAQKDTDATLCANSGDASSSQYSLTCGGGSGIVQSTAMLILQSENAALKREISKYKKKCHQLSRNISCHEDELKKIKDKSETTTSTLGTLHQSEVMSQSNAEVYRQAVVSPSRSDIPPRHKASPGKTGMYRKRVLSPCKTGLHEPQTMSPTKVERHSMPSMSPGKTGPYRKHAMSPVKTDAPLFSALTESPRKNLNLPETINSPKDKFFDARSKSMPYYPTKFFDNSMLGNLPDLDLYAGTATETNENNWWDETNKRETANECKTS